MAGPSNDELVQQQSMAFGTDTGVSGGRGPVSAHASMSCEVSHKSEQTRTTDMSSKMSMTMKR